MELSLPSVLIWFMIVLVGYGILLGVRAKRIRFFVLGIIVFSLLMNL